MPELHFEGQLESDQGACFIRIPPETLAALGERKRAPVKVTLNGYTYRTTIAVYGGKSHPGVRPEGREAAGVAAGGPPPGGVGGACHPPAGGPPRAVPGGRAKHTPRPPEVAAPS